MFDKKARHITEALRSGIPSRTVGQCFSDARPGIMRSISEGLHRCVETGTSEGRILTGKYGEGKTHLLNTVFSMAHEENMVVSYLTLSKESPWDKLHLIYGKLLSNTYLPGREQPGLSSALETLTANSVNGSELLLYAAKHLECDKLYYLLRAYFGSEDLEEKFLLASDLEGDFIATPTLRQIYRRIYGEPAKLNVNFSKTKHIQDYFVFMSHFFKQMGYNGWVLLIDEAELIGRMGKKTRWKAYQNIGSFLDPSPSLQSVYSIFAFSASYIEDVIDGKHEYDSLAELVPEERGAVKAVLDSIAKAPQLLPLTKEEMREILEKVIDYHAKAYDYEKTCDTGEVLDCVLHTGYLLRTKIRAAIEYLDQVYQYGDAGTVEVNQVEEENYGEEIPVLSDSES